MTNFGSMSGRSTNKYFKVISFLSQKLIDAETSQKQIFDSGEDDLPENIDIFDIEMERDLGTTSTLKIKDNIFRMAEGATWTKQLRMWIKFCNAANLYDYARNGNTTKVYGWTQIPILMKKKIDENVLGYEFHSFFNGQDQFAYTLDNSQVQIAPMFADSNVTHISIMDSFNPVSISKQVGKETSVLYCKVDDDQIKDGYAATMNDKGDLFFYIKRNFKQYSLFLKGIYYDQLQDELANGGDFNAENYNPMNFNTDREYVSNLICSIRKSNDHWMIYNKTTNVISYMLNGTADSFDSTQAFIVDPILDVPFQDGAYNSDGTDRTIINDISPGNFNGTLSNPENGQWQTNNTFLSFGSNTAGNGGGCEINFPTLSTLDSASEYTLSFMLKPDTMVNQKTYSEWIISKNYSNNNSFILYRPASSNNLRAEFKSGGNFYAVTVTNAFSSTDWHSIVIKFKSNEQIQLIINGITYSGVTLPADITTAGTLKLFRTNTAFRGSISYLRVFTTKLGSTDTQRLVDEGYHNPLFPKAEKPQPEPVEIPDPIPIPFESVYNLASSFSDLNTVWLNSIEGAAPFFSIYDVTDGTDESFPEEAIYDVSDGSGSSGEPFTEFYTYSPSDNSSIQLSDTDNSAGGVGVSSGSSIIGKKVTRAKFQLKAESSPTGSVYCRIWNSSGSIVATLDYWNGSSLGTLNASSVSSDWTEYEFRNTTFNWGSSSVQAGWVIGIEYNAPSDGDTIHVRRQSSGNPMPNEQAAARNTGDSNFDFDTSGRDAGAKLSTGLGTSSSDPFLYMEYIHNIGNPGSSNSLRYDRIMQKFGSGDTCIGQIPTKVKVKLKKVGSPTGTLRCYLCSGHTGSVVQAEFGTAVNISSIPTTTTEYTFTLPSNVKTIVSGWNIMLFWEGMGSSTTAKVGVLTNSGIVDNHNGNASFIQKYGYVPGFESFENDLLNYTTLDMTGVFYIGGSEFDADMTFTATRTKIYERCMTTDSSLYHKKLTKVIPRLKKVGSPTGNITCVVRKSDGTERFTLKTLNVADLSTSYADVVFDNVFNTTQVELNDRVCLEYSGANGTDYVSVLVNKDVFETTKTIGGTYTSPVYSDNAQIDISGKMYIGGEPDLSSRIRCAQKINTNDSILDGEKVTKVRVFLRNPDAVIGNVHCIVYRGSDDQPMVTIGTKPASEIGPTFESVDFENTNNGYVLDVNDKVAIVFEGGSTTQRIGINVRQNTSYDGDNSHVVRFNGTTYDDYGEGTWDLCGTMWKGGFDFQPPIGTQPDPTPTNNKDLLFCAGNNLLSGFARLLMREFRIYTKEITPNMALNIYNNRYSETARVADEILVSGLYKPF